VQPIQCKSERLAGLHPQSALRVEQMRPWAAFPRSRTGAGALLASSTFGRHADCRRFHRMNSAGREVESSLTALRCGKPRLDLCRAENNPSFKAQRAAKPLVTFLVPENLGFAYASIAGSTVRSVGKEDKPSRTYSCSRLVRRISHGEAQLT
jgi:hypothetical protein